MIDDFDCRIIHHLTLDGRMSIIELSERVNLSQTPVARRVKKLEDNKVITGYTALIDETRLGFSFSVFVSVRLEKQIDDNLLRVVTQNIEDYEKFLLGELTRTEGVASIESSIPLRRVKSQTARTIVI